MAVVRRGGIQRCRAAAEPCDTLCAVSRAVQNADVPGEIKGQMCLANTVCVWGGLLQTDPQERAKTTKGGICRGVVLNQINRSTAERRLLDFSRGV